MKLTILEEIYQVKRARLAAAKVSCSEEKMKIRAERAREGKESGGLRKALSQNRINIIAEIKRASPSRGIIDAYANAGALASRYERAGARAVSVLTEEDFFKGSLSDLAEARRAVSVPILRKDFIFDEYQIWEAAANGADAILLIAAMLDDKRLQRLDATAREFGLDVLVEVHTRDEMTRAGAAGAGIIGVNNRDLRTFSVSLDVSRRLIEFAPPDAILISESGLRSREELMQLFSLGYRGFLIGEMLMRSGNIETDLQALAGASV